MEQFGIIILAAGPSTRLGQPKQLLPVQDTSLLQHVITESVSVTKNVVVVLGAYEETIRQKISELPAEIIYNKDWQEGMSSSIRYGLSQLLAKQNLNAVIIMVADQPFVSSSLLNEMLSKYKESKKTIIACSYKDAIGVPVLFDRIFFSSLKALKGQSGAKKMIADNMDATATVSFPLGHIDIDTKEDYDNFKKINSFN